jgi:hypothetical protein
MEDIDLTPFKLKRKLYARSLLVPTPCKLRERAGVAGEPLPPARIN